VLTAQQQSKVQRGGSPLSFRLDSACAYSPSAEFAPEKMWIPTEAGRGFRFDVGHRSDLKPATIPI